MKHGLPIVVALVLSMTACSLFADLGGLSRGSTEAEKDAAPTTSPDSSAPDSSAPVEGGARFCEGRTHAFCADFETDGLLDDWTNTNVAPEGRVSLSSARASGGMRSLFATLPRRAAKSGTKTALLTRRFDGPWRRMVVDLDMFLESQDWQAGDVNSALVSISMQSKSGNKGVFLTIGRTYANVSGTAGRELATNRWLHVHCDVTPDVRVVAEVDGENYDVALEPFDRNGYEHMVLSLGVNGFNAPAPEFRVYYDNVTVDFP